MLWVLYKHCVPAEVLCASKTRSVVHVNSGRTAHKNGKLFKLTGPCHKLQPRLTDHKQIDSIPVTTRLLCPDSMSPLKLSEEINGSVRLGSGYECLERRRGIAKQQWCGAQAVNCGTLVIRGKLMIHDVITCNFSSYREKLENEILVDFDGNCCKLPCNSTWRNPPTRDNWPAIS